MKSQAAPLFPRLFPALRRLFGLYAGEEAHVFPFARLALLWAFGSSCLDTLSDGLFLEKVGAPSLPQIYLFIALGMMGVSSLVLSSLRFTSPYRILVVALAIGSLISFGAALALPGSPPDWFWYALKIASRMFFAVMIACSWTFTDQYHDLQDAKRVYAIYSASYFLGTILAGLAIRFALDLVGFQGLLFAASLSIGSAIFQARQIAHGLKAVHDDTMEGVFSSSRESISSVIRLIFTSRFTSLLLSLSLLIQLLLTVTEFNYMESFSSLFHSEAHSQAGPQAGEGEIAEFLGSARAFISFGNILFGALFYGRFVRRIGLQNTALITPLFFLLLYSVWVFHDALWVALLGLVAVDGVLFTIEDNCFNLLSNAVPTKLKSKVRIINDSFFEPIGMLVSALLLLALQAESRILGLLLTLAVALVALFIRSTYSKAILTNLRENALHFEQKLSGWLGSLSRREQKEAKKDIFEALEAPSEKGRLLAIDALLELKDPSSLPKILEAGERFGTFSKIELLKKLDKSPFRADPQVLERIDLWGDRSDSPELSKWTSFFLAKRGLTHPDKAEKNLDDPDLLTRAAALLTLKKSHAFSSLEEAALSRTLAAKKLELLLRSERIDEISLALDLLAEEGSLEAAEATLPYLSHESLLVKRSAARSLAQLADGRLSRHAPLLIEELEASRDNIFRLHLLDALGKIADSTLLREILLASLHFRPNERRKTEEILVRMGLKIVPLLLSLTKDPSLPERGRILAGKVLARLALPQLRANLPDILDVEIERAYFYFYFGHTIQEQYPLYDLELLKTALLTGYQSVIDFIIHLLGAAGSLEDPELLVRALHSRNGKVHSQAVESLERTCDWKIFRLIAPLIDDLPLEEKMAACLAWQGDYPKLSLSELLRKLELSPSLFDKIVAIRLKAKLQLPNWRQELLQQMKHSDEIFHQFAYELLES